MHSPIYIYRLESWPHKTKSTAHNSLALQEPVVSSSSAAWKLLEATMHTIQCYLDSLGHGRETRASRTKTQWHYKIYQNDIST